MTESRLEPVRQRTLSDEAAEHLRMAIRNGSLPHGTRLIEEEVAKDLAVSRIPVREAIQRLVEEGLVRKVPHRGAFVYLPSAKEIEEISSLRVVLERFIIERAIARWKPEHEAALHRIVDRMRQAAEERNFQQIYEQDYEFHHTLWKIAEHGIMLEVVAGLRSRISRFLYEANSALTATELTMHVDSHVLLIDIIKSGNVAAAQDEITNHVLGAKNRIVTYCKLMPAETDPK
jgi:DNA-binding GntR family transcriptional regulator